MTGGNGCADLAPIAVFVYKRPQHASRLIDSLLANEGFAGSPVFVFCDGARAEEDLQPVAATRRVVRERLAHLGQIIERDVNHGLAASIIEGVTELTRRYGKVIVLEDDLELHPGCIEYLNAALRRYVGDDRVYHVNAYRFPVPKSDVPSFSRLPASWGWATWARAWAAFEPDAGKLERGIRGADLAAAMDFGGTFPYYAMLRDQVRGRIDSWAIRWYASVLLRRGLALFPSVSQVINGGMDRTGTHCDVTGSYEVDVGVASEAWPAEVAEDALLYGVMQEFFRSTGTTLGRRALRKLKRMLSVDSTGG